MKQTNNAIKFLMAQYRAIFQNAYFKGLATAAVVTMGLAAGQAQAATGNGNLEVGDAPAKTTITVDGATAAATGDTTGLYKFVQVSGGSLDLSKADLTIKGGEAGGTGNVVKGHSTAQGELKLKSLTIKTTNKDHGLLIEGTSDKGASLSVVNNIDIVKGTLSVKAVDGAKQGTVAAQSITLGGTGTKDGEAILVLDDHSSVGNEINANMSKNTAVTLNKGALVKVGNAAKTSAAAAELNAGTLTINDGSITTTGDETTNQGGLTVNLVNGAMNGGSINVLAGDTLNVAFTAIDVKNGETSVKKEFNFSSGKVNNAGGITLTGPGTYIVGETTFEGAGTFAISGSASKDPTVKLSLAKLKEISDSNPLTIASGTAFITDSVDLSTDLAFDNAAAAGKIKADTGTVIKGDDITISDNVTNGAKIKVNAKHLTLGKAGRTAAALTVSELNAEDVTFVNNSATEGYTLHTMDLTLSKTQKNSVDNSVVALQGSINGDLIVNGDSGNKSLTINGGIYTGNGDITLSKSGGLVLSNTKDASESSLTLSEGTTLSVGANNKSFITVGAKSSLDISKATVALDSGDANVIVKINSGTLKASAQNIKDLTTTTGSKSGSIVAISGGTLNVVDDLTIASSLLKTEDLSSGPADIANAISFEETIGGNLLVNGKLTLTGLATAGLELKETVKVKANELDLQVATAKESAVLKSGAYYIYNGLDTNSTADAGITVSGGAVLNLGEIESVKGVNVAKFGEDTKIAKALTTNTGDINVNAGAWKAQAVTVSGTDSILTIGNDGTKLDADGNEIAASLNVQGELKSQIDGGVVVKSTGQLVTNKLNAITSSVTVNGNMTVAGEKQTDPDDESVVTSYGVDLANKAIDVKKGGTLTFGEVATSALKLVDEAEDGTSSGDSIISQVTNDTDNNIEAFKAGALSSDVGSTVNLTFAAGTKFDKAGLDSLKGLLFGDKGAQLKGFLNIGDAEISGLVFEDEGKTKISYDELNKYDGVVSSITNETLKKVQVTKIENGDNIRGSFGSLSSEKMVSGDSITILDSTTLSYADGNKKPGQFTAGQGDALLGLSVQNGALKLENGGSAGNVTLAKDTEVIVNGGEKNATTTLDAIVGVAGTSATLEAGSLVLKGQSKVGTLSTAAGSSLKVEAGNLSLLDAGKSSIEGDLVVAGDLSSKGKLELMGNASAANTTLENGALINGGTLVTGSLALAQGQLVQVGSDGEKGASGVLRVNSASLKGGNLLVDPDWKHAPAYAAISKFADGTTTQNKADAGYVKGNLVVAQNSALFVGLDHKTSDVEAQQILGKYKLAQNELGAYAYLNDKLTLSADSKLIIDGNSSETTFKNATTKVFEIPAAYSKVTYEGNTYNPNAYLADNSAVIVGDNVLSENTTGAALHFDTTNASMYVGQDAVVYLDGEGFASGTRQINLFTDNGNTQTDTNGVLVLGNNLRAETLNGLMYIEYLAGQETSGKFLQLNKSKAENAFNDASAPMKDFLVTYASADLDWKNLGTDAHEAEQYLVDYKVTNAEEAKLGANGEIIKGNDFAKNSYVTITNEAGEKEIFKLADNAFLHNIVTDKSLSGVAADQAARMGVFGGAAESALVATSTSYDAVAGRFGMGQQAGTMTIANNGQGSGMWVTPVYKSHESDGFGADGISYGSDITLYGVALGGDVTLENGLRVGAMFNVGSGDADGQGVASVVSNDFDYFGGSIYAGYAINNFSIVGDVSITTIDSDVEANTSVGKTSTSFDTTALSVGVTGQYSLKLAEMDVTPHAGMRFTRIDMDDYTIESAEFGEVGKYNASTANVFSIPVGVTISKEYVTDTWTVKPSFDLTLTGNFGDDTVDGSVNWNGVSNYTVATKSEFVDNFTYGASVGVAAKTGNFGLGLGLNYTGSSNTDEFGVNANARYMF